MTTDEAIAGRCLAEWEKLARRDDCFDAMVPSDLRAILAALRREREPVATVTGDRSEIDRLVAVLRTSRHGSDISNKAADWIEKLAHAEFEAVVKLNSTPPDALALVAAAYRNAANIVTRAGHSLDAEILARTPADAQAALTAIERAAYERGVRDAANTYRAQQGRDDDEGFPSWDYFLSAEAAILALLTQEGR